MDGLDATRKIRDMGYRNPVIALTANVIMGQEDMFIASGCDGHMYKPIDIRELDSLLCRLIRDKQPPEVLKEARQIMAKRNAGADSSPSQKALVYNELLAVAVRDAENALRVLDDVLHRMKTPGGADMELFTTTVHGIKSSFANIDEIELMSAAHKLEKAGIDKVITLILAETPSFIDALRAFIEKSKPEETDDEDAEPSLDDAIFLLERMHDLKAACRTYSIRDARTAMVELKKKMWPRYIRDIIDEISVNLIRGDFEKVIYDADKTTEMFTSR
jgi:CheY-like chemotaxis protein